MKNAQECDVPGLAHSITASLVPTTFTNVFVASGFPHGGAAAACHERVGGQVYTAIPTSHDRHTRESGYPVIADLRENRDGAAYGIIRLRG
jgi:hypothetical protein